MRFLPLTQTPVATWAASSTVRTSIEREGLITRIEFTAEITPSATIKGGTSSPGGLYRVQLDHVLAGGGHEWTNLPNTGESGNGGQLLHAMNAIDFGGMPGFPDQETISAPDRTYHPITFIWHFGSRPRQSRVIADFVGHSWQGCGRRLRSRTPAGHAPGASASCSAAVERQRFRFRFQSL